MFSDIFIGYFLNYFDLLFGNSNFIIDIDNQLMKNAAFLLFLLSACALNLAMPENILAAVSAGDNWNIDVNEIEFDSSIPTPARPTQAPVKNTISSPNEIVRAEPFGLQISNDFIDFGIISATIPLYRSFKIVLNGGNNGFIVYGYQNNPLWHSGSKTYIPDTTCDNGYCSEVSSALWENTLTYGYGYRCNNIEGDICPIDFNNKNYYKQFADTSKKEFMQKIVSQNSGALNPSAEVMLKLNTSKQQNPGDYNNRITFIAVPGY